MAYKRPISDEKCGCGKKATHKGRGEAGTMSGVHALIDACRYPYAGDRNVGLWRIRRRSGAGLPPDWLRVLQIAPYDCYTTLERTTIGTLHRDMGEIVMDDSPRELKRHLPILLRAHGRVLVSGLGLGCVVRGLLARTEVEHVDVVEIDPVILHLVGPEFDGNPRVTLHEGDSLTYDWPGGTRWDYAWHDCWCEDGKLALLHVKLVARYRDHCRHQGVWGLSREVKRRLPVRLLDMRRVRA